MIAENSSLGCESWSMGWRRVLQSSLDNAGVVSDEVSF